MSTDDTLTGTSVDDVFAGGDGGDFVLGSGGDVFVAADARFGRIDGVYTVRLDGVGQSFDLAGVRGDQINAVVICDVTGSGANTLAIDANMVFSATRGAA